MDLSRWLVEYARICKELSLDPNEDLLAARLLQSLLKKKKKTGIQKLPGPGNKDQASPKKLSCLIKNRPVIIFGAGPSLEKKTGNTKADGSTLICADGAVTALLENKLVPHIVVTDLDGNARDLVRAGKKGSIMLVHAHGNNIPLLKKLVPKLDNIIGTTQTRPLKNIYNFYGFTDGDRCVSLAVHFGAKKITLVGMDFGRIQGKYSKGKEKAAGARKFKKLKIAKRLTRLFMGS